MPIIKKSQQKKIAANEQNNEQQNEQDSKKKKSHRLSIWEISEFMIENNINREKRSCKVCFVSLDESTE